jgi:hypothetical protein
VVDCVRRDGIEVSRGGWVQARAIAHERLFDHTDVPRISRVCTFSRRACT